MILTRLLLQIAFVVAVVCAMNSDFVQDRIHTAKQDMYSAQVAFERLRTADFSFGGNR